LGLTRSRRFNNVILPFEAAPVFRRSANSGYRTVIIHHAILLNSGIGGIIVNSGIVAKAVLAILTVLSAVSWAIAIDKIRSIRRSARQSAKFLDLLPADFSIFEASRYGRQTKESRLPHLLVEASTAVEKQLASIKDPAKIKPDEIAEMAKGAMERKAMTFMSGMEQNLIVLATTASVSPFLGLFGTVWGVMNSFLSMGQMGSASLAVVGSGVAEALITTVFGLGAAIPALVAYNYLVNTIRREGTRMETFISRVSDSIRKEIARELDSAKISL
jgi:biopolymer transport protein TolQ